ncbi:hypothetical protein VCHENC02_0494A, partial [Vibrio harveyi]
MHVIRASSS